VSRVVAPLGIIRAGGFNASRNGKINTSRFMQRAVDVATGHERISRGRPRRSRQQQVSLHYLHMGPCSVRSHPAGLARVARRGFFSVNSEGKIPKSTNGTEN